MIFLANWSCHHSNPVREVPAVFVDVVVDVVLAARAVDPRDGRRRLAIACRCAVHVLGGLGVARVLQTGGRAHPEVLRHRALSAAAKRATFEVC